MSSVAENNTDNLETRRDDYRQSKILTKDIINPIIVTIKDTSRISQLTHRRIKVSVLSSPIYHVHCDELILQIFPSSNDSIYRSPSGPVLISVILPKPVPIVIDDNSSLSSTTRSDKPADCCILSSSMPVLSLLSLKKYSCRCYNHQQRYCFCIFLQVLQI